MKIFARTTCLLALWLAAAPLAGMRAEIEHQYAPLREVKLKLKDFTFPTLDGRAINLRDAANGKRLVLVHYFAAWCHNSNYDVVTINKLYARYKSEGFEVVGVCEYSSADELRAFVEQHRPAYPVCVEGSDKADRAKSTHHKYRREADDKRKWGTPFNVMVRAEDINPEGDTFAKRVHAAAGELIEEDAEKFIKQYLRGGASENK
jgi:peroxiredoxin